MDPEGDRGSGPPGKSQVATGFCRNTGTDPPRETQGPIASRGRSEQSSVKYVDDSKKLSGPLLIEFSGSGHESCACADMF